MKDPRRQLAAFLPGIATHFLKARYKLRHPQASCGSSVPMEQTTSDPEKVSCRRCLRTKHWRDAWTDHAARYAPVHLLRQIREDKGIGQAQVAEALGVQQPGYSRLERGVSEMTLRQFYVVCRALDVDPGEVLTRAWKGTR
jgi:DNA-binding Xre family transcriptional regulator